MTPAEMDEACRPLLSIAKEMSADLGVVTEEEVADPIECADRALAAGGAG